MHQNKCAVHEVSEVGRHFAVHSVLESFPCELAVLCFRSDLCEIIAEHVNTLTAAIFFFHKIIDVIPHVELPVSTGAHLISLKIEKLIGRNIRWNNIPMQLQHCGENDAVKNNI